MKLILIIFIRLNSKRLKNKGILKIGDKTIIEIILMRCLKAFPKNKIVIATSKKRNNDKLFKILKKYKVNFFRGSENNIRNRALLCCKKFNAHGFIRINADRPFFDYSQLIKMIKLFKSNKYDIVTNINSHSKIKGLTLELIKYNIFKKINKKLKKSDTEHIFNYFYRNKNDYKIKNLNQSKKKMNINLALDYKSNLNKIRKIYKYFNYNYYVKTPKVINLVKKKKW
tara:strand:+ start:448 stop:1128 length:681 start_codon:yes stop_codon:yes gene_type:complete